MALEIIFSGIKPQHKKFNYSVVGNADVDKITFKITSAIDDTYSLSELATLDTFIKVESVGGEYIDKISATSTFVSGQKPYVQIDFELKAKTTAYRYLNLQVQFEGNGGAKICQTEKVSLELSGNINADQEIADRYPSVLADLQRQINELKERN